MSEQVSYKGPSTLALYERRKREFFIKGVSFALASGVCYGLYTAFLTLAESQGVWRAWFSGEAWGSGAAPISTFTVTFALAALAAGLNDLASGLWSLIVCAKNRQLVDLLKTVWSKPGAAMMICAIIGGPLSSISYVVALNASTAAGNPGMIVPVAALNCAIGAIMGRILFRQNLSAHQVFGVVVCLVAAALIGGASFSAMGLEALLGCGFALLAALGWGFEGCVAGFGTALIDYRIGIAIRQTTAGLLELLIMFPALTVVGDGIGAVGEIAMAAAADPTIALFLISGFFAMPAYSFWYKGNSMCGAALGMAGNGTYAFWGPFFIWILMGVLNVGGLAADYPPLAPVQWVGALVMVVGIYLMAVEPAGLSPRKRDLS